MSVFSIGIIVILMAAILIVLIFIAIHLRRANLIHRLIFEVLKLSMNPDNLGNLKTSMMRHGLKKILDRKGSTY